MKKCSKCGEEKTLDLYGKEKRAKDGRRSECKECWKKARKEWESKNPDYYYKYFNEVNPNYRRQHYLKNKERELEYSKRWKIENKDKAVESSRLRRQLIRGLKADLTKDQWESTLKYFYGACAYCGTIPETVHKEHFIPAINGGNYTKSNIIPACISCNSSKGVKDFFEWYPNSDVYCSRRKARIVQFIEKEPM